MDKLLAKNILCRCFFLLLCDLVSDSLVAVVSDNR
jgi:hypothetical protein